jgi:DNA polymerase elongation subunit (family B)
MGLAAQAATDLLQLCDNYKLKMKQARADGDDAMGEVFNALQLATKISANAIYGIMLLLSREVGGTITAEARSQNERAMRYLHKKTGGGASMADTDSMSPVVADIRLDPIDRALSAIQRAVCGGNNVEGDHARVSTLINSVIARYTTLLHDLNECITGILEPAWRKPARLEFEKVLFSEVFLAKKMYFALKFEGGVLKFHTAGLTCIKATKTKLQEAAQLIPFTMIVMYDDIDGMCSYIKDLYTFAAVDLRVEEILTTEIKTLCEAIDDEIERDDVYVNKDAVILPVSKRQMSRDEYMRNKERSIESRDAIKHFDSGRAVDIRSRYPLHALPVEYTTASEKINNIATPKTVADKIGAMECLRKGMSKDQAPMFVNMQRSA